MFLIHSHSILRITYQEERPHPMKINIKLFSIIRSLGTHLPTMIALIILAVLNGCSRETSNTQPASDQRKNIPVPVTVAKAASKTVPVELQAIGTVEASTSVTIRSQVEGEIMAVHFKEGEIVKAGELLFTIDPRPYAVLLRQAEAILARNQAELENAKKQAVRYGGVSGKGLVSEEQIDQITASVATLEATIQADEAVVENARLKLGYCNIRSPIAGLAGSLKLDRGNLVKANDNERFLVIINQVHPAYIAFAIPERSLSAVRRQAAAGLLNVRAIAPGEEDRPVSGHLSFIENSVDSSTASIMLRATFPNADRRLWPGQFVHVVLMLGVEHNVTVVPEQAVQTGQKGEYLFVIMANQTAEFRQITTGQNINGERVVKSGLNPGEWVVIDGQLRLTEGSVVKLSAKPETTSGQDGKTALDMEKGKGEKSQ
jgi:multidrug efflux system membrane fusion protein